jgi:hypothetical protein
MNPQANQTPGLGLPQPSFETGQAPVSGVPEAFGPAAPAVQRFEAMSLPSQPAPAAPAAAVQPMPQATPLPAALMTDPVQSVAAAAQADDDSALDEEWVNKAREIVERTHNDPYLQSREISKIKAQYIKVRYNKDIKSSDDQP